MKKSLCLALFCVSLVFCAGAAAAQDDLALAGRWTGFVEHDSNTRDLLIEEKETGVWTGKFNITKHQKPKGIKVTFDPNKREMTLHTPTNGDIALNIANKYRLEGVTYNREGRKRSIVFWKNVCPIYRTDSELGLLGEFSGSWPNSLSITIRIAYVDSEAAAVYYEWGDELSPEVPAGGSWHNVRVRNGGFQFRSRSEQSVFSFILRKEDGRLVLQSRVIENDNLRRNMFADFLKKEG
jgi:hypothetical protein